MDAEQTLGTNSAASPTSARGSSIPRCSNMPRIRGSEVRRTQHLSPTPGVTGTNGTQAHRNSARPVALVRSFQSVWFGALSRPWVQTLQPAPQHPEAAPLPGAPTHPGSQDHRTPKSQDPRDSLTWRSSDSTRITGRTGSSQT